MNLRHLVGWLLRGGAFVVLAIAIFLVGTWCALAIWFRLPAVEWVRTSSAVAMLALAVVAVGFLATSKRWLAVAGYVGVVALVLVWWATIAPSNARDWAADVARSTTATLDGDRLVVSNVRNFTWRSDTDYDQRWEQRSYLLSQVKAVDLIMSYWAGEAIAHTIVSFGFQDGSWLAFSIETRKERHEAYSSIAGFFKQYELAIVAADERDIVRVRSNIRGEDVRVYRLRMTAADARTLLREYVAEANALARKPRFYNTLTANCTTLVFDMVRVMHPGLPLDPRILLSGYLPDYVYDLGAADTSIPLATLRQRAKIRDNALRFGDDPDFSARIRDGIPIPH